MKHLLSIETLTRDRIEELLHLGFRLKALRGKPRHPRPLCGQTWALIFSKTSTRTRVSFEVGIRELGGAALFLDVHDIQLGRGETVEDTARVLSRYAHGVVIRTFAQNEIETFARVGSIPVINALTDDEHPCQILADLMTWAERLRRAAPQKPKRLCDLFQGKTAVFFGDTACNVAQSWIFAAARIGFRLRLAAPRNYQPAAAVLARAGNAGIMLCEDPRAAAKDADLLYTDTWVSMGKEAESRQRQRDLMPYQINASIVRAAGPGALVMHCLPAYRGREISAETFEAHADVIFDEAENRLHIQKAILARLADGKA
ncbi:MAG: ornithine carbamoyltransferase [Verrucomicrobia bacterium]|nr:ornithine carbamoyltransferase [Verrucomicrobiota bacterium]